MSDQKMGNGSNQNKMDADLADEVIRKIKAMSPSHKLRFAAVLSDNGHTELAAEVARIASKQLLAN